MKNRKERIKEFYLMINARCYANGCDIAEDIIKELEEENKLTQWQPIKTAPKDGTDIYTYGDFVYIVCWNGKSWDDGDFRHDIKGLTHWMPLPTKPKK